MIQIRTGESWRHDPRLRAALRRATGTVRAAAARAAEDALAIEIDGVDITAGQAEGALLPSLESLLRATARVLGGAAHATVPFRDGELELVIRRRGASALLTVVTLTRPSRILASDVEVDVEAFAAAALEAAATFCRELAELLPEGEQESRELRAAARELRHAEAAPAPAADVRPDVPAAARPAPAGRFACALEVDDAEGQLLAYDGGRPDLGSLLVRGTLTLVAADGARVAVLAGLPYLVLRDLGSAVDRLLGAVRRGEPRLEIVLARPGRGGVTTLALDLPAGRLAVGGAPPVACVPLELARAFAEAALELGRLARARNPRQAENGHLTELEAGAAERLAQLDELAEGDLAVAAAVGARAPGPARLPQGPLGPGRLRRLAFRRLFEVDVGAPAGEGLLVRSGLVIAAGGAGVAALERATGAILWRAGGAELAAAVPGALLVSRGDELEALAIRSGRRLWVRSLPSPRPTAALALPRGPYLLAGAGVLTAVDPSTGRTLWRHESPGASRVAVAAFGALVAAGTDTGHVYGLDASGRVVWRVRGPGAVLRSPSPVLGLAVVVCAADAGAAALALDPSTGERRFEAQLDYVPASAPVAWGKRIALAGLVAGDAIVTALERDGARDWTAAPPLAGAPLLATAGGLLVARDPAGGLVALGRDGRIRWSRPSPQGAPPAGAVAPAIARGTVIAARDGLAALDARTGDLVGAVSGVAPARIVVDASLAVAVMDGDGLATGYRVATHLSVI
jgi:outer membrane protein assembly factor BamB